jgi:hypothetical protein
MKIRRIGKIISVALLLTVFLYSTAIRELHYAFSSRYHTVAVSHGHKCDHHIHQSQHEEDCLICKLDVNALYDSPTVVYSFAAVFLPRPTVPSVSEVYFSTTHDVYYLRGPPSVA